MILYYNSQGQLVTLTFVGRVCLCPPLQHYEELSVVTNSAHTERQIFECYFKWILPTPTDYTQFGRRTSRWELYTFCQAVVATSGPIVRAEGTKTVSVGLFPSETLHLLQLDCCAISFAGLLRMSTRQSTNNRLSI